MKNDSQMKRFAKMVGVELGEPFVVKKITKSLLPKDLEQKGPFVIEEFRVIHVGKEKVDNLTNDDFLAIIDVLLGTSRVLKKWKPKLGDTYYLVNPLTPQGFIQDTWKDTKEENELFDKGLVLFTKREVRETKDKFFDIINQPPKSRLRKFWDKLKYNLSET